MTSKEAGMATVTKSSWVHLHHADDSEGVIVTTATNQTFTLPLDAAIRACGSVEKLERFTKQFQKLLTRLASWLTDHLDDVEDAYVTLRDAGLLFLVVRKTRRFNEELENSLTGVDLEIAQDPELDLIRLTVLALPMTSRDGIESFLVSPSLQYAK
jgi:hypothetical protein